jgi:phosphoribosyl 1,2-cyclic phosphodiesterase
MEIHTRIEGDTAYDSKASALGKIRVIFWGSRGSLPATVTPAQIKGKIKEAIIRAHGLNLQTGEEIESFIEALPFPLRATYGCNTPCVEIEGSDEYILCDAGTGLRDFGGAIMKHQQESSGHVFNIFLSHLHWDHIQGFPFFRPAYMPGNRINVYGCHHRLEEAFIRQQEEISFPVSLDALAADIRFTVLEPGEEYEIGGFEIRAIPQNHPGGSFGYRFRRGEKIVVYSTDSEHRQDAESEAYLFVDFIKAADLLIFDAQYAHAEAIGIKEDWGHSSNLLAVEMAVKADVKRLCLFHNEHTWDDEQLERFLNDTRRYLEIHEASSALQIHLAYDGLKIEI